MDLELTDQQTELKAISRKFAYEEILPISLEADAYTAPEDCYQPELMVRASELGLRTMKIPVEFGGLGVDTVTEVIVLEEICSADVGFGMCIQHAWREGYALATMATREQRDLYLPDFMDDPTYVTSNAITEEHFGSDAGGNSQDVSVGPRTTAVLDHGEWVLNGRKRLITNANIAQMALILARTDNRVPWRRGSSLFLVPTHTDGFSVGRVENKMGIRMNQNAEIILQDCRVPESNLLGEFNKGKDFGTRMALGSGAKEAAKSLGVARAVFEETVRHARERVQGGRPIIDHQSIGSTLVELEMGIESVRSFVWRAAWAADENRPESHRLDAVVKLFAAETAVRVATTAIEIHGASGILRGSRIEKLMRDAVCLLHLGRAVHATKAHLAVSLDESGAGLLA